MHAYVCVYGMYMGMHARASDFCCMFACICLRTLQETQVQGMHAHHVLLLRGGHSGSSRDVNIGNRADKNLEIASDGDVIELGQGDMPERVCACMYIYTFMKSLGHDTPIDARGRTRTRCKQLTPSPPPPFQAYLSTPPLSGLSCRQKVTRTKPGGRGGRRSSCSLAWAKRVGCCI